MTQLDWRKTSMPPVSDAIPRPPLLPPTVVYDEKVRDNSDSKKQAQLQFEDTALGEWFVAPEEFWAAWKRNSYPFKLAGFSVAKIGDTWKVRLPDWVQRHVNRARRQAKDKMLVKKNTDLAPSNRKRPF